MSTFVGLVVVGLIYIGLPTMTAWGWLRWSNQRDYKDFCPFVSLLAFACATLSGLFALISIAYVQGAHLTFYDVRWARLLRIGLLVSASGILLSLIGIWRRSSLRWHAPLCSFGTLFLWVILAAMD